MMRAHRLLQSAAGTAGGVTRTKKAVPVQPWGEEFQSQSLQSWSTDSSTFISSSQPPPLPPQRFRSVLSPPQNPPPIPPMPVRDSSFQFGTSQAQKKSSWDASGAADSEREVMVPVRIKNGQIIMEINDILKKLGGEKMNATQTPTPIQHQSQQQPQFQSQTQVQPRFQPPPQAFRSTQPRSQASSEEDRENVSFGDFDEDFLRSVNTGNRQKKQIPFKAWEE